ncbi:MAG TPA: ABC transporter permease [Gemmatimonadaceae bacterium]|nr:ABC transporter permease [Gemmatimonadaceae bacterium]
MPDAPRWRRYLRFWRPNVNADVDDELEFHLAERVDELVGLGMDEVAARAYALRRFGDLRRVRDTCRDLAHHQEADMRRSETLDILRRDIVYATRMLRSNAAFTAAVVLTLALGIGATTALFSVVNSVLLRPLPFADSDRIAVLFETFNGGRGRVSVGHFYDWTEQSTVFSATSAWQSRTYTLTDGEPTRLFGARVTPSFFTVVRIAPELGRYFLPTETEASRVVVLSHGFWLTRYDGDPNIIGRDITLGGERHTVVGVAPAAFNLTPTEERLWTPLSFTPEQRNNYGAHSTFVLGKLKPEATLADAQRELERVTEDIRRRHPDNMKQRGVEVRAWSDTLVESYQTQLWVLLGAVTFVLLIACGNVASLLLARATSRRKEIAIRGALGGARTRLVRQLLTESLLLASLGGVAGLVVAAFGVRFLVGAGPTYVPRLAEASLSLDVLGFAVVATVASGLLFGLAPALRATRVDLQTELREGGRGSRAIVRDRTRAALIVTEIAGALVLLVSAGLFLRSIDRLQRVPLGFDPNGVTMVRVALPQDRYSDSTAPQRAFTAMVERIRSIPGVEMAAAGTRVPMWGGSIDVGVTVDGVKQNADRVNVGHVRMVSAGYLETLRMPIKRGRSLREADLAGGAPWVVVVNETFARNVFGDADPLGMRISGWASEENRQWREIVGVVADAHAFGQAEDIPPEIYMPYTQAPDGAWAAFGRSAAIIARAPAGTAIAPAMRRAIQGVDPLVPLYDAQTMDEVLAQAMRMRRFNTTLLSLLGLTGLVLSAIGIYGVIAFFVSQRTHEIGVRVALGASTRSVVRMVVGQALVLATLGVLLGGALALGTTRVLSSMLFEVGARDPVAFVAAAFTLLLVALGAAWMPARKAARVDPMKALAG